MFYLAGPYKEFYLEDGDRVSLQDNIKAMRAEAQTLWLRGFPVFCPHLNTGEFEGDDKIYIEAYLNCLWRFDALVFDSYWKYSEGTKKEIRRMIAIGKPVYHYDDLSLGRIYDKTEEMRHVLY